MVLNDFADNKHVLEVVGVVAEKKCLAANIQLGVQKVAPTFLPLGAKMWDAMLSASMQAPENPDWLTRNLTD